MMVLCLCLRAQVLGHPWWRALLMPAPLPADAFAALFR
jgi:hypothetical protein